MLGQGWVPRDFIKAPAVELVLVSGCGLRNTEQCLLREQGICISSLFFMFTRTAAPKARNAEEKRGLTAQRPIMIVSVNDKVDPQAWNFHSRQLVCWGRMRFYIPRLYVFPGSWWWTGRPGVLQSMGSQSQTRLRDWTELSYFSGELFNVHSLITLLIVTSL